MDRAHAQKAKDSRCWEDEKLSEVGAKNDLTLLLQGNVSLNIKNTGLHHLAFKLLSKWFSYWQCKWCIHQHLSSTQWALDEAFQIQKSWRPVRQMIYADCFFLLYRSCILQVWRSHSHWRESELQVMHIQSPIWALIKTIFNKMVEIKK